MRATIQSSVIALCLSVSTCFAGFGSFFDNMGSCMLDAVKGNILSAVGKEVSKLASALSMNGNVLSEMGLSFSCRIKVPNMSGSPKNLASCIDLGELTADFGNDWFQCQASVDFNQLLMCRETVFEQIDDITQDGVRKLMPFGAMAATIRNKIESLEDKLQAAASGDRFCLFGKSEKLEVVQNKIKNMPEFKVRANSIENMGNLANADYDFRVTQLKERQFIDAIKLLNRVSEPKEYVEMLKQQNYFESEEHGAKIGEYFFDNCVQVDKTQGKLRKASKDIENTFLKYTSNSKQCISGFTAVVKATHKYLNSASEQLKNDMRIMDEGSIDGFISPAVFNSLKEGAKMKVAKECAAKADAQADCVNTEIWKDPAVINSAEAYEKAKSSKPGDNWNYADYEKFMAFSFTESLNNYARAKADIKDNTVALDACNNLKGFSDDFCDKVSKEHAESLENIAGTIKRGAVLIEKARDEMKLYASTDLTAKKAKDNAESSAKAGQAAAEAGKEAIK